MSGSSGARSRRFSIVDDRQSDRAAIEAFIRDAFADNFHANICYFMPRLFGVVDREGRLSGAFGLRTATQRLFAEQYLDKPIELAIGERVGKKVNRGDIVEVGHLCGNCPGAARVTIALLIRHLFSDSAKWVVFTGTSVLRNAFHRVGLFPIEIASARIDALPENMRPLWGSYYEHHPLVLIGRVADGLSTADETVHGGGDEHG